MTPADLKSFTDAYIECALWSSNDESRDDGGDPLDKNYSSLDLAEATEAKIQADCVQFVKENKVDLAAAQYRDTRWSDATLAGHDFWLTRNGHGAGF